MKRPLSEEEIKIRVAKLLQWLTYDQNEYANLLSREESSSAQSGFAEPRLVTRTHATCNGAGCKDCKHGRVHVTVTDPYSRDVHVGVKVNESQASRKAQEASNITSTIRTLQGRERVREGLEALPDAMMANYLRVSKKPRGYNRVVRGFLMLKEHLPEMYVRLPEYDALRAVVILMYRFQRGKFPDPPN